MADKDKGVEGFDAIMKSVRGASNEMVRASRTAARFSKAVDDASNVVVDKVTKSFEELLKNSELLSDKNKEELKNHKLTVQSVRDFMNQLEKSGERIEKVNRDHAKSIKEMADLEREIAKQKEKDGNVDKKLEDRKAELNKEVCKALRDIGLKADDAAAALSKYTAESRKNQAAFIKMTSELEKPASKIGKAFEGMHSKVQTSITGLGEFSVVMALAKKAVSELYGQSIRLANKGLVGSMAQMNISALKLRMTAEEFEGLVSANRDMVALMGGGAEGISNFEAILSESSVGLEYLGKEGKKAASAIMGSFNKAGFGLMSANKDISDSYQANIKGLNKQFKMFNGAFGDSAEEFANLYEQQLKSEALQAKMLSGDTKSVNLQMREIMARTETLKLMGLSNDQVIEMSRRVDTLFNPKENRQADAMTERVASRQALISGAGAVQGDNAVLAKTVADFVTSGEAARFQEMSSEDKKSYMVQNAETFKAIDQVRQMIATKRDKNGGDSSLIGTAFVDRSKAGGNDFSSMADFGKSLNEAKAKGYDQTKGGMAKLAASGNANVLADVNGDATALGTAFNKLRDSVESVTAIMGNPFTSVISAVGAALLFSSTTVKTAVLNAAKTIFGTAQGMATSVGGFFRGITAMIKKVPLLSAIFGTMDGAFNGYNTSTDDYYDRTGIDKEATVVPQVVKDTAVRSIGVMSDVGTGIMKAISFGLYDNNKNFADKQKQNKQAEAYPIQSATRLPNAAASTSTNPSTAAAFQANPNLQSYLAGVAKLETNNGAKSIKGADGTSTNNLYNIKDFSGGGVKAYDKAERSRDAYRAYGSTDESTADMISLLGRKYPGALTAQSPAEFAQALKAGGYATDPNYVAKLTGVINSNQGASALMPPTAASMASPVSAAVPTIAPVAPVTAASQVKPSGNQTLDELQKQTSLLNSMVNIMGRTSASKMGYQMNSQVGAMVTGS